MNWIDRIFRKKEEFLQEIGFDELPAWLEHRYETLSRGLGRHIDHRYSDIEDALMEIKKSTSLLEKAEPEGKFHLKMIKTAMSNRDNMVKQVRMLIDNIDVPEAADVKTILDFHRNATHSLTVCRENMMKSHQYTKMVFLEYSKPVISDLNMLGRLLDGLIEPIHAQRDVLDALEHARTTIINFKNTAQRIETEKKNLQESNEKIVHLKNDIEEKQKALSSLRQSESWKHYQDIQTELDGLEHKRRATESEIRALILPLQKGLNRLKQLSESGRYTLKPEMKKGLYDCLSDPTSARTGFFIEFRNIIESGVLNLPPEKKNKMLELSASIMSSLDQYQKHYQDLGIAIAEKNDQRSKMGIDEKEDDLTRRIKALHDQLASYENEGESSEKLLVSLQEEAAIKKQELHHTLSIIDSRIWVSF